MDSNPVLEALKAESLLEGSHVLGQIAKIRWELSYTSNGDAVSYDDLYARLAAEVDALPRLGLDLSVAPGTEGQYTVQLTMAMEKVADDCERVSQLISNFESRVCDAAGKLKRLHGEFEAWYALAANQVVNDLAQPRARLSSLQVNRLADSEFSRLIGGLDVTLGSMLSAVKLLKMEIKEHKKAQMEKYSLGKDQVNAAWTSQMPLFNDGDDISRDDPGRLLDRKALETEEEVPDDLPAYVSSPAASPPVEVKGTFFKAGTPRPTHLIEEDVHA